MVNSESEVKSLVKKEQPTVCCAGIVHILTIAVGCLLLSGWGVELSEAATEDHLRQITINGKAEPGGAAISGHRIVWSDDRTGNGDIYLYNLATNTERRITMNITGEYQPDISGDRIVWVDTRRVGGADLYLYDLATNTERRITTDSAAPFEPAISGDWIVWEDYRNGDADIYLYDLATNTERRITTDPAEQTQPTISGDRIVWSDERNGNRDIYLYDLATNTERRITTNLALQWFPAISGDRIVWTDWRNGDADIYLYDLATNTERQITTDSSGSQSNASISGNVIVWDDTRNGNRDIYLYDLTINAERPLTAHITDQTYPAIDGRQVVWNDARNGYSDIYLGVYDPASFVPTARQITTDVDAQAFSSISGDRIVWTDWRNGNGDIYLYDLATNTERQITTNSATQNYPCISGDRIVWEDNRHGSWDIYLYDLATNTERRITTNLAAQEFPAISGDLIVWDDTRNGNGDIYLYDLTTNVERRITTNAANQWLPAISENQIVWEDYRNSNVDIYLYDLATDTERRITSDVADQLEPAISGPRIVWQDKRNGSVDGNWDIYLYDLTTNSERRITTDPSNQWFPSISRNRIVWEDYRNGSVRGDIYLYDLSTNTERQLTTDPGSQQWPEISENRVVWTDYRSGNWDIFLYELSEQLNLAAGWNFISPVVQPDNPNFLSIFSALIPCVAGQPCIEKVESIDQVWFGDWPGQGAIYNGTMTQLDPLKSYWIRVSQAVSVPLLGTPISLPHTYTLSQGWSGPSNLWPVAEAIPTVFEAFLPSVEKISTSRGDWFGTWLGIPINNGAISAINPQEGFYVKLSQPQSWTIPAVGRVASTATGVTAASESPWPFVVTPLHMTVIVTSTTFDGLPLATGDWVGAFDAQGHCYGAVEVTSTTRPMLFLNVYGDDGTGVDNGFLPDELMLLNVFQVSTGKEAPAQPQPPQELRWQAQANLFVQVAAVFPNHIPQFGPLADQIVEEGERVTATITATDADGDPLSFSAQLVSGEPLSTLGASFMDEGNGTATFVWTPDYYQAGEYSILVTVTDGHLSTIPPVALLTITVTDVPLQVLSLTDTPDPFVPSAGQTTTIAFRLSVSALVTLQIYNSANELVTTLLSRELRPKGLSTIVWDGKLQGVPMNSGLYTYKLRSKIADARQLLSPYPAIGVISIRSSFPPPNPRGGGSASGCIGVVNGEINPGGSTAISASAPCGTPTK